METVIVLPKGFGYIGEPSPVWGVVEVIVGSRKMDTVADHPLSLTIKPKAESGPANGRLLFGSFFRRNGDAHLISIIISYDGTQRPSKFKVRLDG